MHNFDLITREILRGHPNSGVEDMAEMYRRSPIQNNFWKDKRVDFSKIKCPTYIRGSDVSGLHNMGSIRAWMEIRHNDKWIQWGSYQEWFELYSVPESETHLTEFFDRYLKNIDNGFDKHTPKVRWDALRYGDRKSVQDIVLEDFPVPNTDYQSLYLSPNNRLASSTPETAQSVSYNSEKYGEYVEFTHKFPKGTRLIGLPKAEIYVSCPVQDDFVVFVLLRKLDKDGKPMVHLNFPIERTPLGSVSELDANSSHSVNTWVGPMGILRASHRAIDRSKSMHENFPFHPHEKQEKVPPGTVVKLEIGIWAIGTDFDEGESISLRVSGQNPTAAEFNAWSEPRPDHELNHGEHVVHFGGEYPSKIVIPNIGAP